MKLIVGLGNIGINYEMTRHNIGFMFLDSLAKDFQLDFKKTNKLKGNVAIYKNIDENVIFLKPTTYMNLSGESVRACLDFYKIELDDILVIYDDLDLPTGKIRIRGSGTAGGQKGMANIINVLGTSEIKRLRIGISKIDERIDTISYVLGKFSEQEKLEIDKVLNESSNIIRSYLDLSFDSFMNRYNKNAS